MKMIFNFILKHISLQVCSEMVRTRQGLQTRLGDKGFYFVTFGIKSQKGVAETQTTQYTETTKKTTFGVMTMPQGIEFLYFASSPANTKFLTDEEFTVS